MLTSHVFGLLEFVHHDLCLIFLCQSLRELHDERADHARREDQLHPAQKVLTERQRRRRRTPVR